MGMDEKETEYCIVRELEDSYPILNSQSIDMFKMLQVICNNNQLFAKSMTCNEHIEFVCTFSLLFKCVLYASVILRCIAWQVIDFDLFNKFANSYNFTKIVSLTFPIGIKSTIIKSCKEMADIQHLSNPIDSSLLIMIGFPLISSMRMFVSRRYCLFFIVLIFYLTQTKRMTFA